MPSAPHPDIAEALNLLAQADREANAARKIATYEEAFDLLEGLLAPAADVSTHDRTLAINLRLTHTRGLLAQLPRVMDVDLNTWFDYIRLLMIKLSDDVTATLQVAPEFDEPYRDFVRLWGTEMIDILRRRQ